MTIAVVADPPAGSHAAPSRIRRPGTPKPAARPTMAITVHLTLSDDVANPAAALRALVEHLGAIGDLAVVIAAPQRPDPHPVVHTEAAVDRDTVRLESAVWGDVFTGPRTVDVHIRRVRSKLGARRPLITTVRGVGYRLATSAPIALVRTPATAPHVIGRHP